MDYKKINNKNYTLHLINTDRFKKIRVIVRFTKKYDKEDSAYYKLLGRVLSLNGTKKYKKAKDLSKRLEYLYGMGLSYSFFANSKNMVVESAINFINPKYTYNSFYEEAFDVLKENFENPNIYNGKFNEEIFNLEKENLIKSIMNVKDSSSSYGSIRFDEIFFKGTIYEENNYKNIEDFKNLDNKTLYKKYKELFKSFKIDVFALGELDEEIIIRQVDNLLKKFKQKDDTYKDLYIDLKPKKCERKEEFNTNQSNLYVGLTLDKLANEERDYKLVLYNAILGCMNNSVLFVNVREKNSLCYSIGSTINRFTSTIVIDAGINKKNYEKTMTLIKESLNSMKDEKVIKPLLTNAKKTLEISYNDFYDNPGKIINYYYTNEFSYLPSVEERRKAVLNATVEEIIEIAKKVKLNTVYLLEGSINEED